MSSEQEHVTKLSEVLSSTHPNPDQPIDARYPKRMLRKTANGYFKLFKLIVQKYTECKLRIQSTAFSNESSSVMLATNNFILDTERVVASVLSTEAPRHAWGNLVKRYGELGEYEAPRREDARSVILAVCREWEYLGLHEKNQPTKAVGTERIGVNNDPPVTVSKTVKPRSRHGKSKSPEYKVWLGMRSRCSNPNAKSYRHYGGRGIRVAPEFEDFEAFLSHVGPRPGPEYSLDRIDNNGDYAPGNVRWILRKDQNANRRDPSEWPSNKLKAAAKAAKREAFLAANISSQFRFDEMYLQAVREGESETAIVELINWQV